ncbi:hypothetical protein GCM10023188_41350 [Pontibacter saemangeumensis]|uniref:Uncharacterized protein n=1 Tax=Pontibacter saemangeumensis TaxID=1084525 RepID=A0ABP8M2U9_9BACT
MTKLMLALCAGFCCLAACNEQRSDLGSTAGTGNPTELPDSTAQATAPVPACTAKAPLLLPPDQAITDATLRQYLESLQAAVQAQDAQQLQTLLDPNIRTGFDGSGGWEAFSRQWRPENTSSEIWLLLDNLLRLGGDYMADGNPAAYALPYVYSNWPDSLDAFSHMAVTKPGAILREQPAANATGICTLDRIILQTDYARSYPQGDNTARKEWWYVQTPEGKLSGYLSHADLYSPVGYRALFNRNAQGKWHMTALVAGD